VPSNEEIIRIKAEALRQHSDSLAQTLKQFQELDLLSDDSGDLTGKYQFASIIAHGAARALEVSLLVATDE
jgi:hypothetical protein